ncbi:TRAP transporter small permease [Aneurinibacillus danicus]|jgi:TRAP-type C4-dicarboxylate transport system permease small subunit|uniref:C4-dicarboxylate ABC transporter permease n=1 Tax=Aneurinibacillus danicus TaxID=267746 RepID=A0A511VCQ3_9BACL|nr:TRAP transporter small permease [Aneurinibacillus danicus]GEN36670.1 C4-dicarboxylate ABC transporter permease [Aneurinibacillus danicus]
MQSFIKGIDKINAFLRYFAAFLLAFMSVLIVYQVCVRFLGRYMELELPRWTEELARYSMIWLVLIGASLAVRYSALIGMEAIAERLSEKAQRLLKVLTLILSMVLFVVMIVFGFEMLSHVSAQLSPGLKLPMSIPYAAIPIGGFFMLLNAVAVLLETIKGQSNKEFFKGSE